MARFPIFFSLQFAAAAAAVVILVVAASVHSSLAQSETGAVKTKVFLSPKIEVTPGSVSNKNYLDVDFPRGHIAIKSFDAEIVDGNGKSVPLYETYVHHWVVVRYFQPRPDSGLNQSSATIVNISGVCTDTLGQYFGLGSETRRTPTHVPDPYGIVVGNPADIPAGYDEKWMFNVHVIDTRGAEDRMGCIECRCDLYNVTRSQDGQPLPAGYKGGLVCCYDQTRCRLKEGFSGGANRTLFLKYTVRYVEWNPTIVPARIYILDVADIITTTGTVSTHNCQVEYDIERCSARKVTKKGCIDAKSLNLSLPSGGNLIYGVGHMHAGGIGISLYGEGGREICTSKTIYGKGRSPGNEAGYVVGMTACYPRRGTVKLSAGEKLKLVSKYDNREMHTGVMGLFYFLLADS